MDYINKIFEALKILVPVVFAIFLIFGIDTAPVTESLVLTLLAIIFGLIGGSGISRMRIALRREQ